MHACNGSYLEHLLLPLCLAGNVRDPGPDIAPADAGRSKPSNPGAACSVGSPQARMCRGLESHLDVCNQKKQEVGAQQSGSSTITLDVEL